MIWLVICNWLVMMGVMCVVMNFMGLLIVGLFCSFWRKCWWCWCELKFWLVVFILLKICFVICNFLFVRCFFWYVCWMVSYFVCLVLCLSCLLCQVLWIGQVWNWVSILMFCLLSWVMIVRVLLFCVGKVLFEWYVEFFIGVLWIGWFFFFIQLGRGGYLYVFMSMVLFGKSCCIGVCFWFDCLMCNVFLNEMVLV